MSHHTTDDAAGQATPAPVWGEPGVPVVGDPAQPAGPPAPGPVQAAQAGGVSLPPAPPGVPTAPSREAPSLWGLAGAGAPHAGQAWTGGPPAGPPPPAGAPYPMPQPGMGSGPVGAATTTSTPHRPRRPWGPAALVLAACLGSGLLGGVVGARVGGAVPAGSGAVQAYPSAQPLPDRPAGSIASIAAKALPSVVTIKVRTDNGAGTGSGFVLRDDYVVTNNHVVGEARQTGDISVVFSDGSRAGATLVGRVETYDLAVMRIDRKGVPALPVGDSDKLVVGDPVIAVGAPLGLSSTVTSGIVSAKHRPVTAGGEGDQSFIDAIQTDAAINPGNSGGPLLDAAGNVVGVNTAIARVPGSTGETGGNIGVGFAIPSNQVKRTAEQLIRTGRAEYPIIGVEVDTSYEGPGVRVRTTGARGGNPVSPDGPAAKAGIRAGDLITALDGKPVRDHREFIVSLRAKQVGQRVELTVKRGSVESKVALTLAAGQG